MGRVCCDPPTAGDAARSWRDRWEADVATRGRGRQRHQDLTTMSALALVVCWVCRVLVGGSRKSTERGARDRWPAVLRACEDPAPGLCEDSMK